MRHLAIFTGSTINDILSGKKKIESRFSRKKLPPFGFVSTLDTVIMKQSGGKIVGQFTVSRVISYDHPLQEDFEFIKKTWQKDLCLNDKFFSDNADCRYITLLFIESATKFLFPPVIKKSDQRAWVVLR